MIKAPSVKRHKLFKLLKAVGKETPQGMLSGKNSHVKTQPIYN